MAIDAIKKKYPIIDENGQPSAYPTFASQVFFDDGTALDGKKFGGIADGDLLTVYPVGSIYLSTLASSPASLFGGTWERIEDTFLLASGSTYAAGNTGGEDAHTLTIDEMPAHSHQLPNPDWTESEYVETWPAWAALYSAIQKSTEFNCASGHTQQNGGGLAHNNMPPYLAVYMWKRVA